MVLLFIQCYVFLHVMMRSLSTKIEFSTFYSEFKEGRYKQSQFYGFKQYIFSSHYNEALKAIKDVSELVDEDEVKALADSLVALTKAQNNQIIGFKNYIANVNLLTKLIHIAYYSLGFIFFHIIIFGIFCYQFTLKPQNLYRQSQYALLNQD